MPRRNYSRGLVAPSCDDPLPRGSPRLLSRLSAGLADTEGIDGAACSAETSSLPVASQKAGKSRTAAGSVAATSRISPGARCFMAFRARRTGKGHVRSLASRVWVVIGRYSRKIRCPRYPVPTFARLFKYFFPASGVRLKGASPKCFCADRWGIAILKVWLRTGRLEKILSTMDTRNLQAKAREAGALLKAMGNERRLLISASSREARSPSANSKKRSTSASRRCPSIWRDCGRTGWSRPAARHRPSSIRSTVPRRRRSCWPCRISGPLNGSQPPASQDGG